jgi:hypothetical protein
VGRIARLKAGYMTDAEEVYSYRISYWLSPRFFGSDTQGGATKFVIGLGVEGGKGSPQGEP